MEKRVKSFFKGSIEFWRRYKKNRNAVIGLLIISVFVILYINAWWIAPGDPTKPTYDSLFPPDKKYLMGTDDLGRSILNGVVHGIGVSYFIGFSTILISMILGITVGAFSGYYGGIIDEILMRISELFLLLPRVFLAIVIIAFWGSGIYKIILVLAITFWPSTARLVRAQFLSIKQLDYVDSARVTGCNDVSIIFRHILPNCMAPVVIQGSLAVGSAILLESTLSFLGMGDPNLISWGVMLKWAQPYLDTAWWMAVFPGLSIFFTVLGFNLIGDGINDAMNPRLREL
jgi:peptide/nickel transport system permease protein